MLYLMYSNAFYVGIGEVLNAPQQAPWQFRLTLVCTLSIGFP